MPEARSKGEIDDPDLVSRWHMTVPGSPFKDLVLRWNDGTSAKIRGVIYDPATATKEEKALSREKLDGLIMREQRRYWALYALLREQEGGAHEWA